MRQIICILLFMVFSMASPAIALDDFSNYELGIVRKANSLGAPALDLPMGILSNQEFMVLAPVGFSLVSDAKDYYTPMLILGAESLAYGGVSIIKPLVNRLRPYQVDPTLRLPNGIDTDRSFPSGHTAISFAAATILAEKNPSYALPAYSFATLVAYSRMYNGQHYPSDLLVGSLIGIGAGKLVSWGSDRLQESLGKPFFRPTLMLSDNDTLELGLFGNF